MLRLFDELSENTSTKNKRQFTISTNIRDTCDNWDEFTISGNFVMEYYTEYSKYY